MLVFINKTLVIEKKSTTLFQPEITTKATTVLFEICDAAFPNKEDPDSCLSFYQCEPGPNGSTWTKKECGPGTFYNPQTQVCDFEDSVKKLKPSCDSSSKYHRMQKGCVNADEFHFSPWNYGWMFIWLKIRLHYSLRQTLFVL